MRNTHTKPELFNSSLLPSDFLCLSPIRDVQFVWNDSDDDLIYLDVGRTFAGCYWHAFPPLKYASSPPVCRHTSSLVCGAGVAFAILLGTVSWRFQSLKPYAIIQKVT